MANVQIIPIMQKQLAEAQAELANLEKEYLHLRGQWEGRIAAINDMAKALLTGGEGGDGQGRRDEEGEGKRRAETRADHQPSGPPEEPVAQSATQIDTGCGHSS